MDHNYSLLLILLFPLIGGIIGFYLGKKNKTTRNDWMDIVVFTELVMLGYMGYQLAKGMDALSLELENVFGFGLYLTMDVVRLVLCFTISAIFGIVLQFMKESMKMEEGSNRFYMLYMGIYSMMVGACITNNLFNLFLFVTTALLFAYPMMMHRRDKHVLKNAKIYMVFTIASIVLLALSLVFMLGYLGTLSYRGLYLKPLLNGSSAGIVVGGLLALFVFAIYAGLFPVQFQVTRGSAYGLMEISVILCCIISKMGVLGMVILGSTVFTDSTLYGRILLAIGILATVWGILITLSSTDIRRILMGLDVAVNGFNTLGIAVSALAGTSNGYVVRGNMYMLIMSALSLMVLYMVSLEQVRKVKTFEIKGLIASGKGQPLLMAGCLLACASLIGVPGTAGYLAHALIYRTIWSAIGWKWLVAVYIILWAFFMTGVVRIFMKLFVSKKDETIHILATEEELQAGKKEEQETEPQENKKNPYLFGEILLVVTGALQVVIGVLSNLTLDKMNDAWNTYFFRKSVSKSIPYYQMEEIVSFVVVVALCVAIYLNIVHGILLRAIRNKKNKKLQEENAEL